MKIPILFLTFINLIINYSYGQPQIFENEKFKNIIKENRIKKYIEYNYVHYLFSKKRVLSREYEFDNRANIVRINNYYGNDSLLDYKGFEYNENNQLIEEYWVQKGQKSMIDTFIFQDEKLIEKHSSYGWHSIKKYDNFGRIIESFVYNDRDYKNKIDSTLFSDILFKYEYSNDTNRKVNCVKVFKNGSLNYYEEFDSLNRKILRTDNGQTKQYIYNNSNQLLYEKNIIPKGGYQRIIKYDKSGNIKKDNRKKYYYDKNNNLVKLKIFSWTRICRNAPRRAVYHFTYELF